jgi:hypothetical protein
VATANDILFGEMLKEADGVSALLIDEIGKEMVVHGFML